MSDHVWLSLQEGGDKLTNSKETRRLGNLCIVKVVVWAATFSLGGRD